MQLRDSRPGPGRGRVESAPDFAGLRASRGQETAAGIDERLVDILGLLFRAVEDIRRQLDGKLKSHLSVEEVAAATGRSPYTVREWIKRGRINAIRVTGTGPKGRLLIPRGEMAKLVTSGLAGEVPAALIDQTRPT